MEAPKVRMTTICECHFGMFFQWYSKSPPFIVLSVMFVSSGNIPHDEASRLCDSDQLGKTQRGYQALEESCTAEERVVAVVGDWGWFYRVNEVAEHPPEYASVHGAL